ncbi:NAD-dependent epimerase/dehydratase family protein [Plantactinospora siamensis]|uniref:NAD-dependent epimerase/dehydratase family protein n=1 Tax=Plantactinospora siamensis TaxID=555372 RepID=A0ABV6NYQ7_9ACTN
MRLLILGGTEFVGRAIAAAATGRGWPVTVFHRGRHPAPAGVEVRHGDRATADLDALREGEWDAVVDTWTGAPRAVRDAAALLTGRAHRYAYISSRSVYAYPAPPGLPEDGPLVDGSADAGDVDYPQAKRGGELAATGAYGEHALLVRAGLVLGPGENVGRLPWWLHRIARGGPVLAPGPADLPLQYIDARDLAAFTLDALAAGRHGPYNVVSPSGHTTMGELLHACATATGSTADLRWWDPDRILAAGIEPWTELPVWLPPGEQHDTMHRGDVSRALAAGLRCRPVTDTVTDTWTWLRDLPAAPQRPDRPRAGLDPDREAALLAAPS